jgi:hypothetical protein
MHATAATIAAKPIRFMSSLLTVDCGFTVVI